jgi:hypothetical protein
LADCQWLKRGGDVTNTIITRASLEAAINNPYRTLERLFADRGLSLDGLERLYGLTGAEGDGPAPAGFLALSDVIPTVPGARGMTADGQDVNTIWNQMQTMLEAFNASATQLVSMLSFETAMVNEKVGVPTSPGMQVATEFGRPSKIRVQYIARGFPLEHYDLGDGYTQEFIDEATGAQLVAVQATALNAWESLQSELVLAAIFGNTNYTDKDGVAVKRLYNNDGEVPPKIKRVTHAGTHTHYLTSAGAAVVQADLDTMGDHLEHHGFGEFGVANYVLHANRIDLATIRGFANWIPAETNDRPEILSASGVIVGERGAGVGGLRLMGWVNDWAIVQNQDIPSGYLLGQVTAGAFNSRNIVGKRVHANPSARGYRLIEGNRQNYPLYDSVYDGYAGAGVGQRGAGVVMQITTGAYAVPTFESGS